MTMASAVYAYGDDLRLSAQYLHAASGGAIVTSTTFFGFNPQVYNVTQGPIVTTLLAGQQQTILGLRAAFPLFEGEAIGEYGRASYSTAIAANPGSTRPGNWYHARYAHATGIIDWTADYYRFEPRYATMILPYGTPENIWAVSYSWPGPWLKGTYQLVDTTAVGINRQGFRLRAAITGGRLEAKAIFAVFHQIEPIDVAHATQEGWVEGYYLPQFGGTATLGLQKQYGIWTAYHPGSYDVTFEVLEDTQHRASSAPGAPDAVSMRYPQWTFNLSRRFGGALVTAGLGRWGLYGNFSATPINADLSQRVGWLGAQFREGDRLQTQVTWRWYAADGIPVTLGWVSRLPCTASTQAFSSSSASRWGRRTEAPG